VNPEKKIIVRKATSQDADGIIEVLKSAKLGTETWAGNQGWTRKALNDFLNLKNYTLFVAASDRKVVGFIDYCAFPSFWEGSKQGTINHLFVTPAFQSKGLGAMLLQAVIEQACAEGLGELHVSTEPENIRARRLYARFGFTTVRLLLEREGK